MINERHEEILEAIWVAREKKKSSVQAIRDNCTIQFTDTELTTLKQAHLILVNGDEVHFSHDGEKHGEAIIRRHRLAEVLVTSILKVKKSKMDEIACQVEHSLQEEVEESICTLLGHPEICPDGKPIPPGSCCRNRSKEVLNTVTNRMAWNAGYGYYHGDDDAAGGYNDYEAHVLSTGFRYSF